jgi:hypothetical protein
MTHRVNSWTARDGAKLRLGSAPGSQRKPQEGPWNDQTGTLGPLGRVGPLPGLLLAL